MRTTLFHAVSAALLATGLAACGSEPEPPTQANPDAPAGITVSDGRMNLPAVAGNPAAVYFTIHNGGETDTTIASAYVAGAESAVLHETGGAGMQEIMEISVSAGESVEFAPGGNHVMAMSVDEALEAGGETEVTLTFGNGDKVSFPVRLLAPGEES